MYNKVIVVGTIVTNGKYKLGEKSNKPVFNSRIVSVTTYKTSEGYLKTDKCFFNIQFWGENAGIAKTLLKKGALAFVEGRFLEYEESGSKYYTIKADSFKLINCNN